jgi:hypothetical protein
MNKMEMVKVKEAPIWTAQMIDMSKLKVLEKDYFDIDNTVEGYESAPEKTKKVIVIYLG